MAQSQLQLELAHYAEEVGLLFERWGLPRTAGRIWGWLHVCDPPHQSAQQLAQALSASKGSISTNTRLLENLGLLERAGVPGSRQSHYRIAPGGLEKMLRRRLTGAAQARELAERGLEILAAEGPERARRLREKRDFYSFMERELEALLQHWEERKRRTSGG